MKSEFWAGEYGRKYIIEIEDDEVTVNGSRLGYVAAFARLGVIIDDGDDDEESVAGLCVKSGEFDFVRERIDQLLQAIDDEQVIEYLGLSAE